MDTLGSPSSSSAKKGKLFRLKEWNAVAFRNLEKYVDGDCAICYSVLNGLCSDCKVNDGHIKDCPLSQGVCGHIFHEHCITKCIDRIRKREENEEVTCPLDKTKWEFKKDGPGK